MRMMLVVAVGLGLATAWSSACGSDSASTTTASASGGAGTGTSTGGAITIGSGGNAGEQNCAIASAEIVPSPVDVIFAIDQSSSMGDEIQGVVDNLNTNLVQILSSAGIDYHVIFVAGVNGLPMGPSFFQSNMPVNSSDALTLLLWTYDGYGRQANTCTKTTSPALLWSDKVRFDAHKFFVVVSDDDPSSFDCAPVAATCPVNFPGQCAGCANGCSGYCPMYQCPTYADQPAAWTGGQDFPTELYELLPAGMFGDASSPKWTMHAIIPVTQQLGPTDPLQPLGQVCSFNNNTGETSGVEYQKLAILTGGLRFPSCDTNYSPVFQQIASTITPLACKFKLEQTNLGVPDPNKTNVEIDYGNGPVTILRDDTAPCNGGADGWQFADNNTAVVLCGPACDMLKNSPNATVSITVGCDAQVK